MTERRFVSREAAGDPSVHRVCLACCKETVVAHPAAPGACVLVHGSLVRRTVARACCTTCSSQHLHQIGAITESMGKA